MYEIRCKNAVWGYTMLLGGQVLSPVSHVPRPVSSLVPQFTRSHDALSCRLTS